AGRRVEPSVGRRFCRERLDMPLAGLVEIIGDPCRLFLATGFPNALANRRHSKPRSQRFRLGRKKIRYTTRKAPPSPTGGHPRNSAVTFYFFSAAQRIRLIRIPCCIAVVITVRLRQDP